MSAFLVTRGHVDALVSYCAKHKLSFTIPAEGTTDGAPMTIDSTDPEGARAIGQVLFDENARSLAARYGDDVESAKEGFAEAAAYTFHPFPDAGLDPATIIGGVACFDYQACEADSWNMSLASWITAAIAKRAGWELVHARSIARREPMPYTIDANPSRPDVSAETAPETAPAIAAAADGPLTLKQRLATALAAPEPVQIALELAPAMPIPEPELETARAAMAIKLEPAKAAKPRKSRAKAANDSAPIRAAASSDSAPTAPQRRGKGKAAPTAA